MLHLVEREKVLYPQGLAQYLEWEIKLHHKDLQKWAKMQEKMSSREYAVNESLAK